MSDLRLDPCSHCNGSKLNKAGDDECPWCDGFGTASMEEKILEATGRLSWAEFELDLAGLPEPEGE